MKPKNNEEVIQYEDEIREMSHDEFKGYCQKSSGEISEYCLGIDGGGTKVEFLLTDVNGNVVNHCLLKMGLDYNELGKNGVIEIIELGLNKITGGNTIKKSEIVSVCIGIPCFGEGAQLDADCIGLVKEIFKGAKTKCVNDVEVAYLSSLGFKPGIHDIAGTGAIAFGKNRHGETHRTNGWSTLYSDNGSGYQLGLITYDLLSKQMDGSLDDEAVNLYELLKQKNPELTTPEALLAYCNSHNTRQEIAQMQSLLNEAACLGDEGAIKAFKQAANEHYISICGIYKKLFKEEKDVMVSYSGGIFKGKFLLSELKQKLAESEFPLKLVAPLFPEPVYGAVYQALYLFTGKEEIMPKAPLIDNDKK